MNETHVKSDKKHHDKELYRQMRAVPGETLWKNEVPLFNKATPEERLKKVSVVRAVGAHFATAGTDDQKREVMAWLIGLLHDPAEKVRRYAMAAIPKIGAGQREEKELLALLRKTTNDREKKFLGQTLAKIGGSATLAVVSRVRGLPGHTEQKVKANVARIERPSVIRMHSNFSQFSGLRINLRCRRGLEKILAEEVEERSGKQGKFKIISVRGSVGTVAPAGQFTLADIYAFRCFATAGFVLGTVQAGGDAETIEKLASIIVSPLSYNILTTFTDGSLRYRLEFIARGHQRGAVRQIAGRAYAMNPAILNDSHCALWEIDIYPAGQGAMSVELRPRLSPDLRYYYRTDDIPAASHPPLAACMARLAGKAIDDIVWDPFCGSGLELIEKTLLGGVKSIYGTDLSSEAVAIAKANFAASKEKLVQASFAISDFRNFTRVQGLGPASVTLIITNPPMGRRVRVPNLSGLIADLFAVAAAALKPGGRLVFANPLQIEPRDPSLKLQFRQVIDLGGFDCRLEKYLKAKS